MQHEAGVKDEANPPWNSDDDTLWWWYCSTLYVVIGLLDWIKLQSKETEGTERKRDEREEHGWFQSLNVLFCSNLPLSKD